MSSFYPLELPQTSEQRRSQFFWKCDVSFFNCRVVTSNALVRRCSAANGRYRRTKLNSRSAVGFAFGRINESPDLLRSGLTEGAQVRLLRMYEPGVKSGPSLRSARGWRVRAPHALVRDPAPRRDGFRVSQHVGTIMWDGFSIRDAASHRIVPQYSQQVPRIQRIWFHWDDWDAYFALDGAPKRVLFDEAHARRKLGCLSVGETKSIGLIRTYI